MLELIVPAVVVMVVIVIFVVSVFDNIIKKINFNAKQYFVDKLQDYNDMIDSKKGELEELNKQIEEIRKKELLEDEDSNILESFSLGTRTKTAMQKKLASKQEEETVYDISSPEYREESFFNNYRNIKQQFDIDNEKVIKDFIVNYTNSKDVKEYQTLKKFRDYFDADTTYDCLTLTTEEQYNLIQSVTKKKEKQILKLEDYNEKNFNLIKLLEYTDNRMKEIDPNVYVYVGNKNISYDYIANIVKTKIYKNMIEGVVISYRGQIYDYSI